MSDNTIALVVKIKDKDGADGEVVREFTTSVKAPYAAGHPLTAEEANALNQTRKENIHNYCRGKQGQDAFRAAMAEGATDEQLAALVAARDEGYTFSSGGGFSKLDPETAAIVQLAQNVALKEFQRKDGSMSKSKIVASEEYKARVQELRDNPKIQAAAKNRLAEENEDYS